VPLLSRLPIIGTLFKSRALRADQTELMVLVTPRLVRALDPDEVPAMPVRPGAFLNPSDDESRRVPGDEPDPAEAPGLGDPPANRRPPPPGTVKLPDALPEAAASSHVSHPTHRTGAPAALSRAAAPEVRANAAPSSCRWRR
jgi:hypothetical protein